MDYALINALDGLTIEHRVASLPGMPMSMIAFGPQMVTVPIPVFPPQPKPMQQLASHPIDPERPYRPPGLRHSLSYTSSKPIAMVQIGSSDGAYRPPGLRERSSRDFAQASLHQLSERSSRDFAHQLSEPSLKCTNCERCKNGVCAAGVMLIDAITNDLFLVRNAITGEYADPGGRCDITDVDVETTACRETLEETRFIRLSPELLYTTRHIDISSGRHIYRCFVVKLGGIHCSQFYKTSVGHLPSQYRETDKMTRFSLHTIKAYYNTHHAIRLVSTTGEVCAANDRIERLLHQAFSTHVL